MRTLCVCVRVVFLSLNVFTVIKEGINSQHRLKSTHQSEQMNKQTGGYLICYSRTILSYSYCYKTAYDMKFIALSTS